MRARLALEQSAGDEWTIGDHVRRAAAAGVENARRQIEAARIPLALHHVFAWYWELRASTPEGFSRSPISFQEIDAWIRTTNVVVRPWEVRCIRSMDIAHFLWNRERTEHKKPEQ